MLEDMGIATGVDLDALIDCAHLAQDIVGSRAARSGDARRPPHRDRGGHRVTDQTEIHKRRERALAGNLEKDRAKLAAANKLFVRDRLALLLDDGSFVEDALLANALADDLPADGVVTGTGRIDGRPVCVMANDPTVKAGSWGARTVEKIVRLTETALKHELPVVYLVDSAGARITDQVELFPGRRGAGRIFANQVRLSGRVPQVCCLFGPSAAGGAYIPAFCDVVFMVEGNASMYLGSPRMAAEVIGEEVTLDEMGGARMHATVSGCGDNLVADDAEPRSPPPAGGCRTSRRRGGRDPPVDRRRRRPSRPPSRSPTSCPVEDRRAYDIHKVIAAARRRRLVLRAQAAVRQGAASPGSPGSTAQAVGIVANNPMHLGGVLFNDSCRQGGPLHLAVRRVQRAAAVPRRRPRLHDRQQGREGGDHPPRGEDDHRGRGGDGARRSA